MPKRTTKRNAKPSVYEIVTGLIIEKLEAGVVPWQKPWTSPAGGAFSGPRNLKSRKPYRGVNVFLLGAMGYRSPWWVTYKQAQELGGNVRKGEKSSIAVFWKLLRKEETNKQTGKKETKQIPLLRYFRVFNVEQCDGLDSAIEKANAKTFDAGGKRPEQFDPIDECDRIVAEMPNAPEIKHGGNRASYNPVFDQVSMPDPEQFTSAEHYYNVLFHELTHSTGHQSRVGREFGDRFGSDKYAKEELVAEMGAALLSGMAGIENHTLDNSAAYLKHWLDRLKEDSKLVVQAAAAAQKSCDFVLNVKFANDDKDGDAGSDTKQPAKVAA